jgi:hypothetical protein
MSTQLSAYGINLQFNCSDEIMVAATYSDPRESQALGRIHRINQKHPTRAYKLIVKDSFMDVRLIQRLQKVRPDLIAYMISDEDISNINSEDTKFYHDEIRGDGPAHLAENLWKVLEGLAELPPMPEWFEKATGMGQMGPRRRGPHRLPVSG